MWNIVKKQKKINPQGGCTTPPNVPTLGVSSIQDTAKTNKDLGMLCYIQVEYSVRWLLSFKHVKIIFKNIFKILKKKIIFEKKFNNNKHIVKWLPHY